MAEKRKGDGEKERGEKEKGQAKNANERIEMVM